MKEEIIKEIVKVSEDLRHNILIGNQDRINHLQKLLLHLVQTLDNVTKYDTKSTK